MSDRQESHRSWWQRARSWPDLLTALLLVPLGLGFAVWGLIVRPPLGEGLLWFEVTALVIAVIGALAYAVGVSPVFGLMVTTPLGEPSVLANRDFPALFPGIPFLLLSGACFALAVMLLPNEHFAPVPAALLKCSGLSLALGFAVPITCGLARALDRRRGRP
jgi:hypothetical protein